MKNLEQYEAMHTNVEALGDANKYDEQSIAFLTGTGTKIESRFLDMKAGHFSPDDKEIRDLWEIRMTRNGRTYEFVWGDSIHETERRLSKIIESAGPYVRHNVSPNSGHAFRIGGLQYFDNYGIAKHHIGKALDKWTTTAREWRNITTPEAIAIGMPRAYSLLAGFTTYEPPTVDEFAAEYGYTKPSDAIRIHAAVVHEYNQLRALFDNDELETLALIN